MKSCKNLQAKYHFSIIYLSPLLINGCEALRISKYFNLIRSKLSIKGLEFIVKIDKFLFARKNIIEDGYLFYRWVFRGITRGNPIETLWKFEKNKIKATFINAIDRRLKSNSTISTDS